MNVMYKELNWCVSQKRGQINVPHGNFCKYFKSIKRNHLNTLCLTNSNVVLHQMLAPIKTSWNNKLKIQFELTLQVKVIFDQT